MFNNVTSGYNGTDATWEIIIMLLVAFILGFILRHLFCCKKSTTQEISQVNSTPEPAENKVTRVSAALAAAGIAEPVAGVPVARKVNTIVAPVEEIASEPESLQRVEGIGPKIEGLLWAGGILTMRNLAGADLGTIQKILDDAGPRYRMHNPKSWPVQAELIADEKWDELEKYQDFLVAGRE